MAARILRRIISFKFGRLWEKNADSTNLRFCSGLTVVANTREQNNIPILKPNFSQMIAEQEDTVTLVNNIQMYKNEIDSSHVIQALSAICKIYKNNSYDIKDIQERKEFQKILAILKSHLRRLQLDEVVTAISVLDSIKVPSNTVIFQSLLQLLRLSINDLVFFQIYFLTPILKRQEETNLSNAILQALPLVFSNQYKWQIDSKDIKELSDALRYVSENVKNTEVIDYLILHIKTQIEKYRQYLLKDLDPKIPSSILMSLCKIEILPAEIKPLVDYCYLVCTENIDNFSSDEIMHLFEHILIKLVTDNSSETILYEPLFINLLIEKMIKEDLNISRACKILNYFNKLKHIDFTLLDYIDELYTREGISPKNLKIFIHGMAFANRKTTHWNEISKVSGSSSDTASFNRIDLIFYCHHLLCLDRLDQSLLDYIFSMDLEPHLLTTRTHWTLCSIYQILKTLYPNYQGSLPSDELIESFASIDLAPKIIDECFDNTLKKVVGGPEFVMEYAKTKLYHNIDYVLVLDKGIPTKINRVTENPESTPRNYIEDLDITNTSQVILLNYLEDSMFSKNRSILLGPHAMYIKSLQSMNIKYKVLTVSHLSWINLMEPETIPYVERLLNIKEYSKKKGTKWVRNKR